jgi:hypothetical protein
VIKTVALICHLWQQYINVALLPLASSSVTVRREMVHYNTQTLNRIETTINGVLQRLTDGKNRLCTNFDRVNIPSSDHRVVIVTIDEAEEK